MSITYGKDGHITGFTDDKILVPVKGIAVAKKTVEKKTVEKKTVAKKTVAKKTVAKKTDAKKTDENKKRPRKADDEEKCPKRPRSSSAEPILPTQSADEVVPDVWADLVSFQQTVVDPAVKLLEGLERQNRELDDELQRKLTRGNSDPSPSKRPVPSSPVMRLAEIVKGMNIPQDTKLTTFMLQLAKRKIKAPKKEVDRCCAFLLSLTASKRSNAPSSPSFEF